MTHCIYRHTHRSLILLAGFCMASAAMAHTSGQGSLNTQVAHAFTAGLVHPWTGLDHLMAMLAVGLWSAMTNHRWWIAPLVFAQMLLAGALLGLSGLHLPLAEPMIASSLVVLGLLLIGRTTLPVAAGATLVGLFAVFHGYAHGTELADTAHAWQPLAGMVLSTLILHAIGITAGLVLRMHNRWWSRTAGALVLLTGGALLMQAV